MAPGRCFIATTLYGNNSLNKMKTPDAPFLDAYDYSLWVGGGD
jgi:hypothetical protein